MLAAKRECSQSMVKGKKGNESMWVGERWGESTLYSLGCQFTSKPSQPPQPASLVWKAATLAAECLLQHIGKQSGCETCQMKVHAAQSSIGSSPSDTVPLIWTLLD